jgi:branched-chain amino acid transport system substrate-binding protein
MVNKIKNKFLKPNLKTLLVILFINVYFACIDSSSVQSVYADQSKIIKIVSSMPRTGSANAQSGAIVNGIRLAFEQAENKAGDFTLVYEDWDDASPERGAWDPAVEAANADKAVNDPDIMAYIGTFNSGAAKIAMPKLNKAMLAMVSPAASWPGLTKSGFGEAGEPSIYRPTSSINFFRVFPTDDVQGPQAARWVKESGAKKVFALHDKELYGKGLAELFKKEADKIGLQILGFEGIDGKSSNYKSLAIKMRQLQPDLIYFAGTTQNNAGQLVKDIRSIGMKTPILLPDGCFENAFIHAAGVKNLEGNAFFTFGGLPPRLLKGNGELFYKQYKEKYLSEPEAFAVYGYEAASVIIKAIKNVNIKERAKITDALKTIKNFQGALGTWSFDENGDITLKSLSLNTVKNGSFEFVKELVAAQ